MAAAWVVDELQGVELQDKRLNDRLNEVLSALADRPTASIPAACGGHAEMTAAYRLFDNDKVTSDRILAPHFERTRTRIAAEKVVLLVQDTTEIDLSRPNSSVKDAGPLDGADRRGAFLHLMEAFTPAGIPLGAVDSVAWARDEAPADQSAAEKRRNRRAAAIEDKESHRWPDGVRAARKIAEDCPGTTCVCVADSEADIYEVFAEPRGDVSPVHLLVRLCQDRALARDDNRAPGAKLVREAVLATPVLFTNDISVRGRTAKVACETRSRRQPRQDRQATVEVRALPVTVRAPQRRDRKLPAVKINVILVTEQNPPADDEPVGWMLATTLPVETLDQIQTVIFYYTMRWMIEVFFRTLKTGCRIEDRRFETLDRMLSCLAVYLIVTWRTLLVCHLARTTPDVSCEVLFDASEWRSVWIAVRHAAPPQTPPTLTVMVRLIAQLGGYINRPSRKDPPGPQTVWLGLQRMRDLALAWNLFGPGAARDNV